MATRFERFKTFGALTTGLNHVSLQSRDSDVTGVTSETPIYGLHVVNNSAATLAFNIHGAQFRVYPGAPAPIEMGIPIREYTFTASAATSANEVQIIHKGPQVN